MPPVYSNEEVILKRTTNEITLAKIVGMRVDRLLVELD